MRFFFMVFVEDMGLKLNTFKARKIFALVNYLSSNSPLLAARNVMPCSLSKMPLAVRCCRKSSFKLYPETDE
jgi:hypothetical protein